MQISELGLQDKAGFQEPNTILFNKLLLQMYQPKMIPPL